MATNVAKFANKWIKEVEAWEIIKFPGVGEHRCLETEISFPTERDAGGAGCAWQQPAAPAARVPLRASNTRATPRHQEEMSHRAGEGNGRRGYSHQWVRDKSTGKPASLAPALAEQGVF